MHRFKAKFKVVFLIHRMDPNSSYLLKIKLFGNPKKARKDIRCFCFEKVIDCDLTNYKDLVESIVEQYPPRYLEAAHVQYYDYALKNCPEVKSDQDLMIMFEKHSETKVLHMIIAYCDPSEPYEPITEWDEPNSNIEHEDDTYLRNPRPENEHVGVDEENMYEVEEPMPLDVVLCPNKEKDDEVEASEVEDDEVGESEVEDDEVEEDEELHEAEHTPHVEYDKLDPPMTKGFTYPNMKEFKLALSQHAIKHEF
ncbi:hypothetical protein VPH35_068107 [Triticum aestivum]|uniref:Uncharacterized protein n=1 Tax=Triticum turgidum subsp. durum TaxID=4567 RepID=A0A9R0SLM2_TRITD|nr:unnamed protein product [Triticum turgidum subsp. durum]